MGTELGAFRTKLGGQFLTVEDISQSEWAVITYVQRSSFPVEMATLEATPSRVQRGSKIYRLDPVVDGGIMSRWLAPQICNA